MLIPDGEGFFRTRVTVAVSRQFFGWVMALGEGMAPVSMVHDYAEKHGIRMVVESESLQPTGLEEVARCIRYLKKLDA